MTEYISQILLCILTCASMWALAEKKHKLGFLLGLLGEPFWIYSSFHGKLWGMFLVSLWCLVQNAKGYYNHKGEVL